MNDDAPDPQLAAIARQARDLTVRLEELQRAAATEDLSVVDRARVLLALADATDALDQLLDRLNAADDIPHDPAA